MSIIKAVSELFELYTLLMIIRIFLSWVPNINWYTQPFKILKTVTDWVLEPFRRVIPPIGMLDISPIVAFIFVYLLQFVICSVILPIFVR